MRIFGTICPFVRAAYVRRTLPIIRSKEALCIPVFRKAHKNNPPLQISKFIKKIDDGAPGRPLSIGIRI